MVEAEDAAFQLNANRLGFTQPSTTFHLASDCSDDPSYLNVFPAASQSESNILVWSRMDKNRALFVPDETVSASVVWDPATGGPTVYESAESGCVVNDNIGTENQHLMWYLIPLRLVLNLHEVFPPPYHVDMR
jgi:hypothetical protein